MSCEWYHDELNQKDERQGDIPTKHALDADLDTFVREVLQNANDAGPVDKDEPIEVTFRFRHLTRGDDLEEFRRAFGWDELHPHLDAAADEEKDLSLRKFLDEEDDDLVLLTIEDENTEGLSGAEDAEESNYTALVRDMHRSNKDEAQGGSHGVGGTVLWAFSGISTVLFTSNPSATGEGAPPRFVGRSYLPDHTIGTDLFKGYGWFGVEDSHDRGGRPVSAWGHEARNVAERLQVDRPARVGTSATVVGFREPGENQPTGDELDSVLKEIQTAAVENFWPAILRNRLEVYVQGPGDDTRRPANLDTVPEVRPFVDAYRRMYEDSGSLGEPEEVESEHIAFDFPDRTDGDPTPDEGTVTLSVRTAGPAEEAHRNKVAVFRGAGMVVKYVDMDDVAKYGSDFHAILACGEARTEPGDEANDDDWHVERMLRAAEPAAHDEWTGTPRLKNEYKRGRVGTVKDLQGGLLRDRLRELVSEDDNGAGERLDTFEKHFPVGDRGGGSDGGGVSTPGSISRDLHSLAFADDHWEFEASLEPRHTDGPWAAKVWLTHLFESGGDGEQLPIDSVELADGSEGVDLRVEGGKVVLRSDESEAIRVRCKSHPTGPPDPTSGRTGRTGVRHELVEEEVEPS